MKVALFTVGLLVVGLIIAAYIHGGRYEIVVANDHVVWRVDRFTGDIWACGIPDEDQKIGCGKLTEGGYVHDDEV